MSDPRKKGPIDGFVLSLRSVLEARKRAMLDLNVSLEDLEPVIAALPSMREPTVAMLHGGLGMAVKAAVPRGDLPRLIPLLKQLGATDIAVSKLEQIVP
jgi:ATP phosphoribosyltransferase-like protein